MLSEYVAKIRPAATLALVAVGCSLAVSCAGDDPVDPTLAVLRLELDSCVAGTGNRATAAPIGRGLAVTVAHPFDAIAGFSVIAPDGSSTEATLVFRDRDRDIALIKFVDDVLPLPVRIGLDVTTDQPPDGVRIAYHRPEGTFVADATILRRVGVTLDGVGRRDGYELAADIEPGDSGSPVVNDQGQIVGLVFATSRTDDHGWAIAASEFVDLNDGGGAIDLSCE